MGDGMSDYALKTDVAKEYIPLVEKVAMLVHKISGNKLGDKQFFMIETRLRKRMLELGIKNPFDYEKYIDQNMQRETGILVGLITTHHTFFFREFTHFELLKKMLPDLVANVKKRGDKTIRVWSAACSRGQEAYSIAMFLDFYLSQLDPSISFEILGSDIDEESVKIANNGVYHQNDIKEIPMNFLGNHWAKGTGDIAMYAKVKDSIKKKCQFKPGNLMNPNLTAGNQLFDVIFCRNVFIYFEQSQIEKICGLLLKHMHPHSIFFSGISESLTGYNVEFSSIGASAYKIKAKVDNVKAPEPRPVPNLNILKPKDHVKVPMPSMPMTTSIPAMVEHPEIYKVMCVDDSPSIHTLLKKILAKSEGFEIVAHAMNGLEAMEKLKTVKVDIITLDIHMPQMDGLEYLQKNYNKNHPPVVILSSASREDSDTAIKALKLGASDFVEKPSLQNLEEKGEEIRTKIKTVVSDHLMGFKISSYDIEVAHKISVLDPLHKLRVLTGSISDLKKMKEFFKHSSGVQPPTVILFEGQSEVIEGLIKEHARDFKLKVNFYNDEKTELKVDEIYFADMKKWVNVIASKHSNYITSIMCFGIVSKGCAENILNFKNAQLLLEDMGPAQNGKSHLKDVASDIVPMTSFAYMANVFFSKK
jgi:chemotaxis protein methyltransferase CheR